MRLFAAVDPPAPELEQLALALPPQREEGMRWVPRHQWHVTLAFFGEVPDATVPDLVTRLERAASRTEPMTLALRGAGTFPRQAAKARVLWVGLAGDIEHLGRLADRCSAAGRRCGVAMEDRPFRAHLTLARSRRTPTDMTSAVEGLRDYAGDTWRVTSFRLVRSTVGATVTHETVQPFPLTA